MKNDGWIRLHRKIMDGPDWLSEAFTRAQAWVDLLLLANHKSRFIRRRGVMVAVDRGMVGYSERELAERWRWSRDKVRRFLMELIEREMIGRKDAEISISNATKSTEEKKEKSVGYDLFGVETIPKTIPKNQVFLHNQTKKTIPKKTSVSNLIYIINYERYQGNNTENHTEDHTEDHTRTRKLKNVKKYTENFFSEISELRNRYPDQDLIDQAISAIASTRKSNRIADSVLLAQLKAWVRYPTQQVQTGIRIYLDKDYAGQGKDEKYLLGIIRKQKPAPERELSGPKVREITPENIGELYAN